jgi:hypothetical protein
MVAVLIFYSIGLVIPLVVGLREAFSPSAKQPRLVPRADLF